jgi:hypothetical protein
VARSSGASPWRMHVSSSSDSTLHFKSNRVLGATTITSRTEVRTQHARVGLALHSHSPRYVCLCIWRCLGGVRLELRLLIRSCLWKTSARRCFRD